MRIGGLRSAHMIAVLVLGLAPLPAAAQDAADNVVATDIPALSDAPALTPDETAALGQALLFDPTQFAAAAPAKSLRRPNLTPPHGFALSRTDKPDGSSTVAMKQVLASEWDAKVGADLDMAANPSAAYRPDRPLTTTSDGASGAAWASLGVTPYATLDARVDPGNDQGRLAGTLKHAIPLGDRFAVTLQNSTSVTETFGAAGPSAPAGLPVVALPQDAGAPAPTQVWGSRQAVTFDILPTGTTLAAGLSSTSTDPVTHNTLSAEQKLLGPLRVTTSVSDLGQPTSNKSITAGFKLDW